MEQAASAAFTLPANAPTRQYLEIPLQIPGGGTTPSGEATPTRPTICPSAISTATASSNTCSSGIRPTPRTIRRAGYTGNVFLDAYELNGTRLWRIDLGRNIRAGAHYTQFLVYDFDGDGKAEVMCKTADGTRSGTGQVIGSSSADHRNSSGYILAGPEFLTVFNGQTGAVLATTNYVPARGNVGDWGDTYGNRVDRFLAGVAYLDGQRPSAIFSRGYYTRAVIAAWDWRNGQLTQRWVFDSNSGGQRLRGPGQPQPVASPTSTATAARRSSSAPLTINDNGTAMYATGLGHGDALHVGDFDPLPRRARDLGHPRVEQPAGLPTCVDARTGARIFATPNNNGVRRPGPRRGRRHLAGNAGAEYWGAGPGMTGPAQRLGQPTSAASRAPRTSSSGGTPTRCASCSTATTSTSTARAATRAC